MLTIIRGSDISVSVILQKKYSTGIVFPDNLTGKTISVVYKDSSNNVVTKTTPTDVSITDATLGRFVWNISDTESETFKVGNLDFDVYADLGTERVIYKFVGQISVKDRIR